MTDTPLSGRIALVTGASRGIGAATAIALGTAGAHVVLTARTPGGLEEVEDAIHAAGGTATIAPLDLTDGDAIPRLASAVQDRWGVLDALILNAASLGSLTPVSAIDPKELSTVLTLNVSAQVALLGSFDGMLRKAAAGRVVGVTSSVGAVPRPYWGVYGASKAAFDTLLACYAAELRQISRVRVATLDPGATRTKMRARAYPGEDPASVKPPEVVAQRILSLLTDDFETGTRVRVD